MGWELRLSKRTQILILLTTNCFKRNALMTFRKGDSSIRCRYLWKACWGVEFRHVQIHRKTLIPWRFWSTWPEKVSVARGWSLGGWDLWGWYFNTWLTVFRFKWNALHFYISILTVWNTNCEWVFLRHVMVFAWERTWRISNYLPFRLELSIDYQDLTNSEVCAGLGVKSYDS